jgi:hypothetical protein
MLTIINNALNWYQASGIQATVINIPLVEWLMLIMLLSICLLLRLSRPGLIIAYLFTYWWGWLFCVSSGLIDQQFRSLFLTGYIVFGILVLTLSIIAMTVSSRSQGD